MKVTKILIYVFSVFILVYSLIFLTLSYKSITESNRFFESYGEELKKWKGVDEEQYSLVLEEFKLHAKKYKIENDLDSAALQLLTFFSLSLCFLVLCYFAFTLFKEHLKKVNKVILSIPMVIFILPYVFNYPSDSSDISGFFSEVTFAYVVILIFSLSLNKYKDFILYMLCIPLIMSPNLILYLQMMFIEM